MARAIKTTRKICTCCGEEKPPTTGFYLSHSMLYKHNDGRMSVCKDCLFERYQMYVNKYGDEFKALYHLCMNFDIYFNKELVESAYKQENRSNGMDGLFKIYLTKVNSLMQYKGKCSFESDYIVLDDSVIKELEDKYKKIDTEKEEDNFNLIKITSKIRRRWGKGYSDEEYEDLEYFYEEYKGNLDHKNDFMKLELIQEMCTIKLIRDKAKRNGDYKTAREYSDLLSKKMADADLKPSQRRAYGEMAGETVCIDIREIIENYEPVAKPLPQFIDVDKLKKIYEDTFLKPFLKVQGLMSSGGDKNGK